MNSNNSVYNWIIFIFLSITWGTSFILMKRGLESFSGLQVASLRLFISFIFLSPIIIKNFRKIKRNQWKQLIFAGIIGSGLPAILFPLAQTKISSSITGVLNTLVPLFTVIIGLLFFKMKLGKLKAIGALLGLVGAIGLLSVSGGISFEHENLAYALLVIIATISYGTNVNYIKNYLKDIDAVNITAFGFLFMGPVAAIYLFSTDFTTILQTDDFAWMNLLYITILALFSTCIAVILFNLLIKRASAIFASSVTYVIPIFAIMWGLLDGETIEIQQILFVIIIILAVYTINKGNQVEDEYEVEKVNKINSID